MTVGLWTVQAVVWSVQIVLNIADNGHTVFLFLSASMVCLSVFMIVSTRTSRVWFSPSGLRRGGMRWLVAGTDLDWDEVTGIVSGTWASPKSLEVRTASAVVPVSGRPNARQLEQIYRWHAAARSGGPP